MAKSTPNPNTILFLYEGETEAEFYRKILTEHIPERKIRRNYSNLKGVYSLNDKVKARINSYLSNESFADCKNINVFIAYDREGDRSVQPLLNKPVLEREFIYDKSRINSINEIVATQDLESWFFFDIEGIYQFLRVPNAEKNLKAFPNTEATNNKTLSTLFHRYRKHYQKGKRVEGLLAKLDLKKIFDNVDELKTAIDLIKTFIPD